MLQPTANDNGDEPAGFVPECSVAMRIYEFIRSTPRQWILGKHTFRAIDQRHVVPVAEAIACMPHPNSPGQAPPAPSPHQHTTRSKQHLRLV